IRVSALEDFAIEIVVEPEANFNNAMGQESLTRFDQPRKKKNNNNKKRKPNTSPNSNPNQSASQTQNPNQNPNQNRQNKKPIIINKNEQKK
ncbi:MAG TPA: hypothetical protein PKH91_01485, partial [Flavobacterium sp.]|nr:hypothetical protein [Flavobacterium sp.]